MADFINKELTALGCTNSPYACDDATLRQAWTTAQTKAQGLQPGFGPDDAALIAYGLVRGGIKLVTAMAGAANEAPIVVKGSLSWPSTASTPTELARQLNNLYREGAPPQLIQQTVNQAALGSTHNSGASEVVLGSYIRGSANSYEAVAEARGATYFSMSDWSAVQRQLEFSNADMWKINQAFLSKKTQREELAKYFSTLTHDYYDHQEIAARLGVSSRRERTTSMDVSGGGDTDELQGVVEQVRKELEATGDTVHVTRDGDNLSIRVQYSEIDYKRSEFSQVQVRDGTIEFVRSPTGYVVRNTQNDYLNGVRETLLAKVEKAQCAPLKKVIISMFDIPSARLRSKFFHELVNSLPGFVRRDVTDVYVFKAKPESDTADDGESSSSDSDTHVERVFLRGSGVSRSELLNELLDEEDYYIIKMGWTATETMGGGNVFDIEAAFSDPRECTGFSFILSGVFPQEEGKISGRRRPPYKYEIDAISRVIESKARDLVAALRTEYGGNSGAP